MFNMYFVLYCSESLFTTEISSGLWPANQYKDGLFSELSDTSSKVKKYSLYKFPRMSPRWFQSISVMGYSIVIFIH